MENQNPMQPTPQPINSAPQIPVQPEQSSGSSKKVIAIILILILLSAVAGGLIYFRNMLPFNSSSPAQVVIDTFDDLKGELESIDVGTSEADLSQFDKDLNSL